LSFIQRDAPASIVMLPFTSDGQKGAVAVVGSKGMGLTR